MRIYFCLRKYLTLSKYLFFHVQDASHPEKLFKLGQAVRAKVVEASVQPHRFVLSLSGREGRVDVEMFW